MGCFSILFRTVQAIKFSSALLAALQSRTPSLFPASMFVGVFFSFVLGWDALSSCFVLSKLSNYLDLLSSRFIFRLNGCIWSMPTYFFCLKVGNDHAPMVVSSRSIARPSYFTSQAFFSCPCPCCVCTCYHFPI